MTIATKNGVPIVKSGAIARNCACCADFYFVEQGASTCWFDVGNAHIVKVEETSTTFSVDGLGVIGISSVSRAAIEQFVRYGGQSFTLSVMGRKTYSFPVDSLESVSLSSQGSRNTGAAGQWSHPVGANASTLCGPTRSPAGTGGQGAYLLSVSKSQSSEPAYICTLTLGCVTFAGAFDLGFVFGGGNTAIGKYFYVAVDNQNVFSTLNGQPALTCGSGPKIESAIVDKNWIRPIWRFPDDCIAFLVEGWIVPA